MVAASLDRPQSWSIWRIESIHTCTARTSVQNLCAATSWPDLICPLQIERHDSHESSWFVHNGRVYDATAFLKDHPGGAESILIVAGQDATDEFNAIHSAKAKAMLNDYLVGKVAPAGSVSPAAQPAIVEVCLSQLFDGSCPSRPSECVKARFMLNHPISGKAASAGRIAHSAHNPALAGMSLAGDVSSGAPPPPPPPPLLLFHQSRQGPAEWLPQL